MTDETLRDLHEFELPYNRRVILREVRFDSGLKMTRLVFFEGKRVTQIDLDDASAQQLGSALLSGAQT
jgi:uncharacterized protein DUF6967